MRPRNLALDASYRTYIVWGKTFLSPCFKCHDHQLSMFTAAMGFFGDSIMFVRGLWLDLDLVADLFCKKDRTAWAFSGVILKQLGNRKKIERYLKRKRSFLRKGKKYRYCSMICRNLSCEHFKTRYFNICS